MTPTLVCRSARGFTLLELLVVLAIIAMGSIIVIPNISGMGGKTFNAQVRDAVNLLNYERRTAVVSGQLANAIFVSNIVDDSEQDPQREGSALDLGDDDQIWKSNQISLAYRDSTDRVRPVDERLEVSFFPEGGSTGGAIIFSQDNRRAVVTIDPFSGRVALEPVDD